MGAGFNNSFSGTFRVKSLWITVFKVFFIIGVKLKDS
jgi:hypothetical protein